MCVVYASVCMSCISGCTGMCLCIMCMYGLDICVCVCVFVSVNVSVCFMLLFVCIYICVHVCVYCVCMGVYVCCVTVWLCVVVFLPPHHGAAGHSASSLAIVCEGLAVVTQIRASAPVPEDTSARALCPQLGSADNSEESSQPGLGCSLPSPHSLLCRGREGNSTGSSVILHRCARTS